MSDLSPQKINSVTPYQLLMPYQLQWLQCRKRYMAWEKSRRVGATWTDALWSVKKRLTNKVDHLFSSADYDVALEFISYCRMWAQVFNEMLNGQIIDLSQWTQDTGIFPNGSRVIAKSSNPKSFRGYRGDVTLDEIAWHDKASEVFKAAQPCLLWDANAQMHLISSHSAQEHFFYKLCRDIERGDKPRWFLNRVTIEDAVNQGIAEKIEGKHKYEDNPRSAFLAEVRAGCATEEDYLQEYMCEPSANTTLIRDSDYAAVNLGPVGDSLNYDANYGELYVGIDVGRTHDLTVVWVIERGYVTKEKNPFLPDHLRDVFRTLAVKSWRNTPFPIQEAGIRQIVGHPCVSKVLVDMGSVGRGMAESLADEFAGIVEPFAVTAVRKGQCFEKVKQFVQQKRISLPDDPLVRSDFLAVRKVVSDKGVVSYDGKTALTHCDFAMACGLALEATGCQTRIDTHSTAPVVERDPFYDLIENAPL